ncbi:hypothetical protein Tco_0324111 [Tanacetum coccineum]
MYPTHTKIINSTIGVDQIDSDIIFDLPNGNVNSGSIKKDTHVPDLCALEQLARNTYHEAEKQQIFAQKVQKQNTNLTSQLELYKERVRVLENINGDNTYLNEFLEADKRAKHLSQSLSLKYNCWTIDYAQINALYKDFVPQKELSAEQKYFPSSFIPSDKNSNATPSIPASMPTSINGKKYILVIVDDYYRYTMGYFLHSKDETPKIIKKEKFIAQLI